MVKKKFISVLLPVYNADQFLAETLDSLLRQTNKNFEVIAVNDGSKDSSLSILQEYAARDDRIIVVDQKNQGLVKTLNLAASKANGEYLARIDADDIALPRRFELQLKAMEENPTRVLIAGGFDVMNEDGEILYHDAVPTENSDILHAMYSRNPLAHGSVLIRRSAFEEVGGYSEDCGPTEDYELWTRLSKIGEIHAVPETIFRWRVNPNGITSTKSDVMERHMKVNLDNFQKMHPYSYVSRSELLSIGARYIEMNSLYGIAMKEHVLRDLTDVSFVLIKQGHPGKAIRQLLAVASTGRTGFRFVRYRINKAVKYHGSKLFKSSR